MATGDGLRNFEPQPSHKDGSLASTLIFELPYPTNGKTLSLDKCNVQRPPLHGGSLLKLGLVSMTLRPRVFALDR
ncbi:hypothetical protein TNCV_2369331 [Trichonephila clavipes]|nr:hypothetical protein TNCV_2369331 [Trichonephila clavipes]